MVGVAARARSAFRRNKATDTHGEAALVAFLERAHVVVVDLGGDPLANRYFVLVEEFLTKFSLRYDLRRPFSLHPTLPGVFARMVTELKAINECRRPSSTTDAGFRGVDPRPACWSVFKPHQDVHQRQVNLLEALGQACPTVTENTLGRICDQLGTAPNAVWPHDRVRDAMKDLYKFACDYPGIRHGGTPANARRDIDMRDMVAISVLLTGFTPYLSHQVD